MKQTHKRIALLGMVFLVLVALVFGFLRLRNSPVPFAVHPVAENPRLLTVSDVERLLKMNFRIVRTVQQVPRAVKDSFPSVAHEPFSMVNPGHEMSTDAILPGVPNERLLFAGLTDKTAIVVFERGGYVGAFHVAVLDYGNGGGVWGAMLDGFSVHDLDSLRKAVENHHFTMWENVR